MGGGEERVTLVYYAKQFVLDVDELDKNYRLALYGLYGYHGLNIYRDLP